MIERFFRTKEYVIQVKDSFSHLKSLYQNDMIEESQYLELKRDMERDLESQWNYYEKKIVEAFSGYILFWEKHKYLRRFEAEAIAQEITNQRIRLRNLGLNV